MYNILPLEQRADPRMIQEFKHFSTALIADSMGRFGAMKPHIRPVYSGITLVGSAITVQTYRSDNLMIHVGLEMAESGDILVVDAGGVTNAGLWGDLMTAMAQIKQLGGLVIEGGVRDIADIINKQFPVYSQSISPLGGFKNNGGSVNIPITCGGIVVNPGDIIIGDDDGIVVVPSKQAEAVLSICLKTQKKEDEFRKGMVEGKSLFELLNLAGQLEAMHLQMPSVE